MSPFNFLNTSVKSYLRKSTIRGIGLFALVDIKKDENVFPVWEGDTDWYSLSVIQFTKLPKEVGAYILRSYVNDLSTSYALVKFRLVKDTNFLFSEPLALLNTAFEQGNVDSETGIALKNIRKNQELTGNYTLSSQIKMI